MKNNINLPEIRFPQFNAHWLVSMIEDHFEFKNGLNKEKEYFGRGIPIINFKDVFKLQSITQDDISGLVDLNEDEIIRYSAMKGDVFFTRTSETIDDIGMSATLIEEVRNCVYSGFVLRARPLISKNFVPLFTSYLFNTKNVRKEIVIKSSMTTRALTSGTLLNKVYFKFPKEVKEQQKIASFLSAVDKKINLLESKIEHLEQYKKGVVQKIFNQEIRFKPVPNETSGNENGKSFPEWEKKKGNEVFKSVSNKDHNGELPILAITQEFGAIPRDQIEYNITVTTKSVESYKKVEKGDFIISLRSFQGGIEYSEYEGICSPAYIILKNIIPINDTFYKVFLKTPNYIKELNRTLEGIRDGKMISFKYFSDVSVPYPSIKEQTKIAQFLSSLDEKINLHKTQLEKMKTWKKGLLQKMFV